MTVNGTKVTRDIEDNLFLAYFLRETLGLTGTHVGCDTTQCGCCVVHVNGTSVKSCTMLAIQANGAEVRTIEGLAVGDKLHPVQEAFREHHALQCGFCTPGILTTMHALLTQEPDAPEERVRHVLSGNICRCTGYLPIVDAVLEAATAYRRKARS
jgi:carbon-monoxide dehydrogenase small subunit